jgi:hypothetical protein
MDHNFETVTIQIGSTRNINGRAVAHLRPVEFEAQELGRYGTLTGDNDTRGIDQTLYKTEDGRLIVYNKDWSLWQGEPTTYSLHQVDEADLSPTGEFSDLGYESGFGRPLTLDEALTGEL